MDRMICLYDAISESNRARVATDAARTLNSATQQSRNLTASQAFKYFDHITSVACFWTAQGMKAPKRGRVDGLLHPLRLTYCICSFREPW